MLKGCSKLSKLRFEPGEYIRRKKDNQLYQIMWVFRFVDDPYNWRFELEERKSEVISSETLFQRLVCEIFSNSKTPSNKDRIIKDPIDRNDYSHSRDEFFSGNRTIVTNETMLNEFERTKK
jgi:hypothetical protein